MMQATSFANKNKQMNEKKPSFCCNLSLNSVFSCFLKRKTAKFSSAIGVIGSLLKCLPCSNVLSYVRTTATTTKCKRKNVSALLW